MKPNNHPESCVCPNCWKSKRVKFFQKTPPPSDPLGVAAVTDRAKLVAEKIAECQECPHDELDHGICLSCGMDRDDNSHNYGKVWVGGLFEEVPEVEPAAPTREPAEGATPLTDEAWKRISAKEPISDWQRFAEMHDACKEVETALAEAKAQLAEAQRPWSVVLTSAIFQRHNCKVIDVGYADRILVVECDALTAENERLAALVEKREKERDVWQKAVPDQCPVTGLPFFTLIDGKPTYGGPRDSYTIPTFDADEHGPIHERALSRVRYDHDIGGWHEEGETIRLKLITDDTLIEAEETRAQLTAAQAQNAAMAQAAEECRDIILNGRGHLEATLDNDQTNAVLRSFDDTIGNALSPSCVAELLEELDGYKASERTLAQFLGKIAEVLGLPPCDPPEILYVVKGLTARNAKLEGDAAKWQPIETAPMDGSEILLNGPVLGTMIGRHDWRQGANPDHWRVNNSRYELKDFTHWMPLPARQALDSAPEGRTE